MHTPEEFIAIVQKSIESIAYPQEPAELYNPIRYELSLGGKRIRPVLTLLACERNFPQFHVVARRRHGQSRHTPGKTYRTRQME